MTTTAWTTVFDDAPGFSRYFVDAESTKWALLAELEEDLIKFDLLRVPSAGPAQLFTLAADDPIWEAIREPTMSDAPLMNFIEDVLEALKTKKPSFTTAEPTKTTLKIVFKETRSFRLTAALEFLVREEVSSTVASLLLRQARIHDAAKQTKPALPTPVLATPSVTTLSTKVADAAPAPLAISSIETVLEVKEPKEKEVVRVMVPVPKVPRGKNPTGIQFGSKKKL